MNCSKLRPTVGYPILSLSRSWLFFNFLILVEGPTTCSFRVAAKVGPLKCPRRKRGRCDLWNRQRRKKSGMCGACSWRIRHGSCQLISSLNPSLVWNHPRGSSQEYGRGILWNDGNALKSGIWKPHTRGNGPHFFICFSEAFLKVEAGGVESKGRETNDWEADKWLWGPPSLLLKESMASCALFYFILCICVCGAWFFLWATEDED